MAASTARIASKTLVRVLFLLNHTDNANLEDQTCIICQKQMGQCFDLRKKQQLNRIASNITDPAFLLNKVINAIKVRPNTF